MSAEKVLNKVSREYEEWAKALFREKAAMDYRSGMHASRMKGRKDREAEVQAAKQEAQAANQRAQTAERERENAVQKIAELERRLREAISR
jgi:chromosome segregation ATPase